MADTRGLQLTKSRKGAGGYYVIHLTWSSRTSRLRPLPLPEETYHEVPTIIGADELGGACRAGEVMQRTGEVTKARDRRSEEV